MEFEGLSPEVLQGQLLKATLVLRNEGAATAGEVFIKLSQPLFVFYLSQVIDGDGNSAKGSSLSSKEKDARGLLSLYGKCDVFRPFWKFLNILLQVDDVVILDVHYVLSSLALIISETLILLFLCRWVVHCFASRRGHHHCPRTGAALRGVADGQQARPAKGVSAGGI